MTRIESDKLTAHILDDIAESICDLTPFDADSILDELVHRLNRPATRMMLLPDARESDDSYEHNHGCLSVAECNR